MDHVNTVIVGASAAGLACAARLNKKKINYRIVEKHCHVAHAWRNHYDRLHLHTNKSASHLPYFKFPESVAKYPAKQEVVEYLENYCKEIGVHPSFNNKVTKIYRSAHYWITQTEQEEIESKHVVICTGNTNVPKTYIKKGLSNFSGKIIHSAQYKNGHEFKSKKVLVVGFGNSACEIAICLHEHGALPSMSVRSKVNVIPRDILGIPVLQIGIWQSALSPKFVDKLNEPLVRFLVGDIEKYGLKKLPCGPIEQIVNQHQIPLLDIGTMKLIKEGHIKVFGDILEIKKNSVLFENGDEEPFDAIITAIGYETGIEQFITLSRERRADIQLKICERKYFGENNLYFCGFYVSPTGMLREIKKESKIIANKIRSENLRELRMG